MQNGGEEVEQEKKDNAVQQGGKHKSVEAPEQHLPAKKSEPKKGASAKSTSSALEALLSIGTSFGKIQGCVDFLASDVEGIC